VELTFLDRSYKFQVASEDTVEWKWPDRPRNFEEFYNPYRECYVDICGHNYPLCVKEVKTLILKPRTDEIAEAWVDLEYGFGIVGKEAFQTGMYSARSVSEDNANKVMVSILISTVEATEITNFKAFARQ